MSFENEKVSETQTNIIASTFNDEKAKRKEDILWTLEEEYLFFEAHTVLGNKWAKYTSIIKDKSTKDLKNHFHACIIKSVRRIINNKYDSELKDVMRCFYACDYLRSLADKMENLTPSQIKKLNKKRYRYNPKVLIKNKKLSIEKIHSYSIMLMKEVLFKNEVITRLIQRFNPMIHIELENINNLFALLIKTKLFLNCIYLNENNSVSDSNSQLAVTNFIYDNYNPVYIINSHLGR